MNAWIKRNKGPDEVVSIIPNTENTDATLVYNLHAAFEEDDLGRILFDARGYWIYDGNCLTIAEQEQLARFIMNYVETV